MAQQAPNAASESDDDAVQVPMPTVARFIRQLSHDLRNHLNAAELQSAYLVEVAGDTETKDEVQRLREMLSEIGTSLHRLTTSLADVRLTVMPYEAAMLMDDLRAKVAQLYPDQSREIDWQLNAGAQLLEIDPQVLLPAFLELFANAFQHERGSGPLQASAEIRDERFVFQLTEPKSAFSGAMENWGREPFAKLKHGHYGLGLPRVRSIVREHRGRLNAHYDSPSSSLVTTVELPLGTET